MAGITIGLTPGRVANSEWIKLRSLRSTAWTLAASVIVSIGIAILLCTLARIHVDAGKQLIASPATLSLYGAYFAPLTVGVLGVLVVTGEYATGMIRATLTAVPGRLPVLLAKLGVLALVVLVLSEAALLSAFGIGQAILAAPHAGVSLADPGVLRTVLGTGIYVTLVALFGAVLGFVIRNTAGAMTTLFGVMLVLPVLANVLPPAWTKHVVGYLPSNAGQAIMSVRQLPGMLAPWTGLAVFVGYVVVVAAVASACLAKRDA